MATELPRNLTDIRRDWGGLSAYQRFETAIAFVLTVVIAAVIVIALSRLLITVFETLIIRALSPLDHEVFQLVFAEIMTLLIALEFNHTLHYVITGEKGIVQARVVIIIAQLALARKIIVTDFTSASPMWVIGLAALVTSLGTAYWLVSSSNRSARDSRER